MREPNRQRHEVSRLVAGIAEHHSLVTSTLAVQQILATRTSPEFHGTVDARCDIGALSVQGHQHRTGRAVEALLVVVIANAVHRGANNLWNIDAGFGGDLSCDEHHTGGHERLTGHPRVGVLIEECIKD